MWAAHLIKLEPIFSECHFSVWKMPCTNHVRTYQIRKGTLWGNWALPWCCFRGLLCQNHSPFCSQVKYYGHRLHLAPWRLLPPVIGKTQVQSRKLKAIEFLNLLQCHSTAFVTNCSANKTASTGGAGCREHTYQAGAAGFVALVARVERPTSLLHAKHPNQGRWDLHAHQTKCWT